MISDAEGAAVAPKSSPINRAVVKRLILARLAVIRPALVPKLRRVSSESFNYLAARLQNIIDDELRDHPSLGATIRIGGK
jgi:hypothetical protein